MEFAKGHGTGNDFVIIPDLANAIHLSPARVRLLCDRRKGIGADGVMRVVPGRTTDWFMDYRNADGTVPEMCGNGLRVFARYLVNTGLAQPGVIHIETRAGIRIVELGADGPVIADMGFVQLLGRTRATMGSIVLEGVHVDVGTPHIVCMVDNPNLTDFDFTQGPAVDEVAFPLGVNLEIAVISEPNKVEMRVYERGVGETHSCGTGIVATAFAAAHQCGFAVVDWVVEVKGGIVTVIVNENGAYLNGDAQIVAHGETWL